MNYIPNLEFKEEILKEIGIKTIDELFSDIPEIVRINRLNLPDGKTEMEVKKEITDTLKKNKRTLSFLGGGIYDNYVPSAVKAIIQRSEFYTSYTPYQPEVSQGMLQAMFEYQSMIAELTGMDAANASMYDWATSLAEAVLMCSRITRKNEFIIPKNIHWEKKSVLRNYATGAKLKIKEIGYDEKTGEIALDELSNTVNNNTAGVYVENPNLFGVFENEVDEIKNIIGKALFVAGVNPLTLGIIKSPDEYGADVVVGEGQSFGSPMNFGGPLLGLFACKKEYVRQMPGRLIGMTKDNDGRRAFCMTLQTREQHIRREKAASNICTNESLCALSTVVYLSLIGSEGLEKIGKELVSKAKFLADEINRIDGFKAPLFSSCHFNEFIVRTEKDIDRIHKSLLEKGIESGLVLKKQFPELENAMLCTVSETHSEEDMLRLINALKEVALNGK
ncbi:MAG: aminomethyl-transferring glycine dehydrogenase [Euryarchaeota archaeon CG01_land_8_20_14_3_00_38_12]|nr:MAG: aminomethyl-transferring glycine dehydrogenase [Euryarchaeota archaeon CG01_land_8_20_14_3_00_38_12]PJB22035.1 MAG: aminomethyl-transferring glycine dehydrogenase [Euryarchaeota archaeon CG_4_9_14_3_um_filter_38_12]